MVAFKWPFLSILHWNFKPFFFVYVTYRHAFMYNNSTCQSSLFNVFITEDNCNALWHLLWPGWIVSISSGLLGKCQSNWPGDQLHVFFFRNFPCLLWRNFGLALQPLFTFLELLVLLKTVCMSSLTCFHSGIYSVSVTADHKPRQHFHTRPATGQIMGLI